MANVFKYKDNVDTDVIIPARYLAESKIEELARYCMIDLDPTFVQKVQPGDILVAGKNFGCGSSREHAPVVIKANGIACVIAVSFARIFYRNAFNTGLAILECPEAAQDIDATDQIHVDFQNGIITNETKGKIYRCPAFPPFIQNIIASQGLIGYVKEKLKHEL